MPFPNGAVYAFEKVGNTIYIGGSFSEVDSVSHGGLARFDAVTGVTDAWSPFVDNNHVTCLGQAGNKLIAGGSFNAMNGQTRYGICMFDLGTGNLESWSDTANFTSWRMGIGTYNNYYYYNKIQGFSGDTRKVYCAANFTPSTLSFGMASSMCPGLMVCENRKGISTSRPRRLTGENSNSANPLWVMKVL